MTLTFSEKVVIAFKLICGVEYESIAEELGKNVDEINSVAEIHGNIVEVSHFFNLAQHMPLKGSMYPVMENVLFCWYVDIEQQNNKITAKQLAEKAKIVLQILNEQPALPNVTPFTASRSWLNGFRTRFNIPIPKRKSSTAKAAPVDEHEKRTYDSDAETFLPEESTTAPNRAEQCEPVFSTSNTEEMINCSDFVSEFKVEADTIEAQDSSIFPIVKVIKSEPDVNQCSNDLNGVITDDDENVVLTEHDANVVLADDDADVALAPDANVCVQNIDIDDETWQDSENANDFDDSGAGDETPKTNKRKRPALIIDENSSSEEFGEPELLDEGAGKKPKLSEKILVPTRGVLKSIYLQDFKENTVMRTFKPVLKYARESGWPKKDMCALNKLYEKSLKSCGGTKIQKTITHFFKKKK